MWLVVLPTSPGHLCFVLLWENINCRDFNWIRVWFVVTLRGRGCEKTACALSFLSTVRSSFRVYSGALHHCCSWGPVSASVPCLPPLRGWSPAIGWLQSGILVCEEHLWGWGAEREGHTPHTVLKSHSECARRKHTVGSNSCCLLEILLFKTIFPLK